jgi:transposase
MRYELADDEWIAIKPMLPNKPRGVPRVNDRRVLNGIFWVLGSGVPLCRTHRRDNHRFGDEAACWGRQVIDPVGTLRKLWVSTRRIK